MSRLRALAAALEPGRAWSLGHAGRVGSLSRRLALRIGLTPDEADVVGLAGRLHDIGAIGQTRAGAVAQLCQAHPVVGAQLVAPFDLLGVAAPMIRHHHERIDGSGYPDGLRGDDIPVGARIIAIADEYDHLTVRGPDADALSHDKALAHLVRHARRTLDGTLISAFIDLSLP